MALYKPYRRRVHLLLLINIAALAAIGWSLWRDRAPTHQIHQVPEPFRSHLMNGTFPSAFLGTDYRERERWQERVSSQVLPSFSQDGKYVLTAFGDTLRLYNVASGSLVRTWSLPAAHRPGQIKLSSVHKENRWYLCHSDRFDPSLTPAVYSLTPDQQDLGEPIRGLSSLDSISPSGRFLLSDTSSSDIYGPQPAPKVYVHDRQTGQTEVLDIPESATLFVPYFLYDSGAPHIYTWDAKTQQFYFFDLETGKRLPTPSWLANSESQYCRYLKDTILTAHKDGTIKVRSRANPERILKSYPTEIRNFNRLGITQDKDFIIVEGAGILKQTQANNWFCMVLDTSGKGRNKVFQRALPITPIPGTPMSEIAQVFWTGAYCLERTWQQDKRTHRREMYLGDLNSQKEVLFRWEVFTFDVAISPNKEYAAWTDRHSGDLLIWRTPLSAD